MQARICDLCGVIYAHYGSTEAEKQGPNTIGLEQRAANYGCEKYRNFDACPDCMKAVFGLLRERGARGLDKW